MRFMRNVTQRGVSCVLISHRLKEVLANVDRVVVMRDGAVVAQQLAQIFRKRCWSSGWA